MHRFAGIIWPCRREAIFLPVDRASGEDRVLEGVVAARGISSEMPPSDDAIMSEGG
jgi:hypothetical protein